MAVNFVIQKADSRRQTFEAVAAAEELDASGECLDYSTAKKEFSKWSDDCAARSSGRSRGNLREMHGPIAAGHLIDVRYDDAGKKIHVVGHVDDAGTWRKLESGTLLGVSIGGSYLKRWDSTVDGKKCVRYTPKIVECSLVDSPCIRSARVFSLTKADGTVEDVVVKGSVAGEYGSDEEAGYADPGHQSDGKPRYPLKQDGEHSEERIRSAWDFINKPKNAEKYSAQALASIKRRIVRAWTSHIDPGGPPELAAKILANKLERTSINARTTNRYTRHGLAVIKDAKEHQMHELVKLLETLTSEDGSSTLRKTIGDALTDELIAATHTEVIARLAKQVTPHPEIVDDKSQALHKAFKAVHAHGKTFTVGM